MSTGTKEPIVGIKTMKFLQDKQGWGISSVMFRPAVWPSVLSGPAQCVPGKVRIDDVVHVSPHHFNPDPVTAPVLECTCGWYAHHPWAVQLPIPPVGEGTGAFRAVVTGHGKLQIHEVGFRAQFLKVIMLIAPPLSTDYPQRLAHPSEPDQDWIRIMHEASERYGVPVVDYRRLSTNVLREFGRIEPKSTDPFGYTSS